MGWGGVRPNAGRKKIGEGESRAKTPIYIRLEQSVVDAIDASGMSRTKYIERAIIDYMGKATE